MKTLFTISHFWNFLGIFFLLPLNISASNQTVDISALDTITDILSSTMLYVDEPPFDRPDVIIQHDFKNYYPQNFHENTVEKANKRYWVKIKLENKSNQSKRGHIHFGTFDRIMAYRIGNKSALDKFQFLGRLYKKEIHDKSPDISLLPINLKAGEKISLLIHISSGSHIISDALEIPLEFVPQGYELSYATGSKSYYKGLLFIGILAVIGFLSLGCLIFYFVSKDLKFLSFTLVGLMTFLYYVRDCESYFNFPILWAHWNELVQQTEVLVRVCIGLSMLIFTLTLFDFGKWRSLIIKLSVAQGAFALFTGVWIFFRIDPILHFTRLEPLLYLGQISLSICNTLFMFFILWQAGERYSKAYVIGVLSYIFISYAGLFVNLYFPALAETFLSSNLISLYGITLFLFFMAYILFLGMYKSKKEFIKESLKAEHLQKLNTTKNKLITNITHEFRTPLTVIKGVSRNLNGNEKAKNLISKNSKQLLGLVNQMLDLSKIESGTMTVAKDKIELISFLTILTDSFSSLAADKFINLNFYSELRQLWIYSDKEKLNHIIQNLISNALRYTQDYGKVMVVCSQNGEQFEIKVIDNGMGISEDVQDKVFERFFQIEKSAAEGTGIGLAFVKELVSLIRGEIRLESQLHKGSSFIISLPYEKAPEEKLIPEPKESFDDAIFSLGIVDDNLATVLLVEDNMDLRNYVLELLSPKFNLLSAKDGALGLDIARQEIPDLIITDVMMPVMDGVELCTALRKDSKTNHIPIIMLTAKVDKAARREGLMAGADAYLSKPFDEEELFIRVNTLLNNRKLVQEHYLEHQVLHNASDLDKQFLAAVKNIIIENYRQETFNQDNLCKQLLISRTQLYRKLKALTGQTPSEMIKEKRLSQAKSLLEGGKMNISEACFDCGFKDVSYFSKVFKQKYGLKPSEVDVIRLY